MFAKLGFFCCFLLISHSILPSHAQTLNSHDHIDAWDPTQWHHVNQQGVKQGQIRFCDQEWVPFTVRKNAPKVIKCNGNDLIWLSYEVHIQQVHQGTFSSLNDHFAVVIAHGDECTNPHPTAHDATQADCHNHEEFNTNKGEKCVRKNIAVNTYDSNVGCFIVYCTNHQSDCKIWVKSYWTKIVEVYPSFQTVRPGATSITINGANLASNISLIKVKCMDDEQRILPCSVSSVDGVTGNQATIEFAKPLLKKHRGKIYLRLDSDKGGWLKPVPVAVVIGDVNPWISMTVLATCVLIGAAVTGVFCVCWRSQRTLAKAKKKRLAKEKRERDAMRMSMETAMNYEIVGLH